MTTRKNLIYIIVTALILSCAVFYFIRKTSHAGEVFVKAVPIQTVNGWGYNIMADEKIYIHQEFIPAVAGKHGFKTEEDALKVGNLVVNRIKLNQMTMITPDDLQKLDIQP